MNNNWKTLRNMLLEQLEDIRHKRGSSGNYSTCSKCYNEVLKVMDAIDNNTQNLLHPFNCVWKTDEEWPTPFRINAEISPAHCRGSLFSKTPHHRNKGTVPPLPA